MNSRDKGKRGEREWAKFLRDNFGLNARRGVQFQGSLDSPDVVGGWAGTHCEVKRVEPEHWNIYVALEQAVRDSGGTLLPYVAHRFNGLEWNITIRAKDLIRFLELVKGGLNVG
jgi:Holliday junction resolvase